MTYFFNGGEERALRGERRELVPSPRDVPTYDHKPQMSASAAAQAFVNAWREDRPGFAIINFANADMVGHTGVIEAAVAGRRDRRRLPRPGRRRRARERRRLRRDRRSRQRRPHARAGRQPEHGALAQPGAADRDRPGRDAARRRRHTRGRGSDRARPAWPRATGGDDRPHPDRRTAARRDERLAQAARGVLRRLRRQPLRLAARSTARSCRRRSRLAPSASSS